MSMHEIFYHVVERLVDCCIQEIYGIRGPGGQGGRSWAWIHHQIWHATSADGSSFGACCGSSDDQDSVWGIGLNIFHDIQLLLSIIGPCGQRQGVQFVLSAPLWFWTPGKRTLSPHHMEKGMIFFWFNHVQFMPTQPLTKTAALQSRHRTF